MRTLTAIRRPAAVLLLALALPALSACSGADSSSTASPSASPASSPAPAVTPSATASSEPAASPSSSAATAKSPEDDAYCKALKTATKEISGLSKDKSPESVKALVDTVTKVQVKAPDGVKKDWTEFRDLVKKAAAGDTAAIKKGRDKITEIGKRVDKDALKRCGSTSG